MTASNFLIRCSHMPYMLRASFVVFLVLLVSDNFPLMLLTEAALLLYQTVSGLSTAFFLPISSSPHRGDKNYLNIIHHSCQYLFYRCFFPINCKFKCPTFFGNSLIMYIVSYLVKGMSRASGFCSFILPFTSVSLTSFCSRSVLTDRLPSGEDRVWDSVPRFLL